MFTIKKRNSVIESPKAVNQSPKSILRKTRPDPNTPRKVGFYDDVGKPLVQYKDIPPREINETINPMFPNEKAATHLLFHPQKGVNQINQMTWNVYRVKNAPTPKEGCPEVKMIEEQRLEAEGISKFPLFGTFDAFDPPHLLMDGIMRARNPVPVIPLTGPLYSAPAPVPMEITQQVAPSQHTFEPVEPSQNTYQQVFETPSDQMANQNNETEFVNASVFSLMAKLKQRGLIPGENPAPSSDNSNPMEPPRARRPSRWTQVGFKINKTCTYFINRPNGCTRGDSCRFEHDEAERDRRQKEIQQGQHQRGGEDSWRPRFPRQQRDQRMPYNEDRDRRRVHRSRSP